ncbi:hypothetical protein ACIBSR_15865 [Streptomyces sp. NPDC049936]|uniref:hypothetical protein n=1 Tax=Streptomyces sp. NPDC049936 TaxID=3365599 RepID=UPI0037AD565A
MTGDSKGNEANARRVKHPVPLAVCVCCYVLAAIAAMFFLVDRAGALALIALWIVHGVLLIALIRRLGARESSTYAALFVVITSVMSVYVFDLARDDITLQYRGERVTARVVKERLDPAQGRKARHSHYALRRADGSRVPGPEMETTTDLYDVGQALTVIEDPEGELKPRTPGQADATAELLGAGALGLAGIGAVVWMAWRGSDAASRRADRRQSGGVRRAYKSVTGDHATAEEQEEKLREVLRTQPLDRRGYIKVQPEEYPDLSVHRAARIAWEMGLRAEALGNRGSWRFGEKVIEEVPHD